MATSMILGAFLCVFLVFTSMTVVSSQNCTKINQCQCKYDNGTFLDLQPLDSGTQNYSAFQDQPSEDGYWYSWNPCTPFCEVHCEGAAVCQNVSKPHGLYYTCGKHDNTTFKNGYQYWSGSENTMNITGLVVEYQYRQTGNTRSSIVKLNCDEGIEGKLEAYGEFFGRGTMIYFFNFTSKYVCPQRSLTNMTATLNVTCPHPWETSTASTTTVTTVSTATTTTATTTTTPPASLFPLSWINLTLIAIVGIIVLLMGYCIIGIVVNTFRGKRGSHLIPNSRCWQMVLMKITCNCCSWTQEAIHKPLIED